MSRRFYWVENDREVLCVGGRAACVRFYTHNGGSFAGLRLFHVLNQSERPPLGAPAEFGGAA